MNEYVTKLGDAEHLMRGWDFTGASHANTDDGRVHGRVEVAGAAVTLRLYRQSAAGAADMVASGTIASTPGALSLAGANDSGLSGGVTMSAAPTGAEFELSVFYAADSDLQAREPNLATALDAQGVLAGNPGFETFLRAAKRDIDASIERRLGAFDAGFESLRHPHFIVTSDLGALCAAKALERLFWYLRRQENDGASLTARHWEHEYRRLAARLSIVVATNDGATRVLHLPRQTLRRL